MNTAIEPIAIVGLAGRFPGANNPTELWANLQAGRGSIRTPSNAELLTAGADRSNINDPAYVHAVAEPGAADAFDADFFGMTPREARVCDPQTRMFLECSHAALENAGYDYNRVSDVGVFGSTGPSDYLELVHRSEGHNLRGSADTIKSLNLPDYLAPLVSYTLGLRGPSFAVSAACAGSLLAVHLAAASLRAGDCRMALAGGVDITLPLGHGYWWEREGTLSRDGRCRPFDANASGTVYGSGAGIIVLKRLSDALDDHDHIRAVLLATTVNNDGGMAAGFTAPSVSGQAGVIAEALQLAGIRSDQIGMVEGHASASPLGDQIELAALSAAFRHEGDPTPASCALGSIKGNIGHLGRAAGVTSLIKAALALENGLIPRSGDFTHPHPDLKLAQTPFYIPNENVSWPYSTKITRYASVNAFGYGGSNAHAVLAQAPAPTPTSQAPRPQIVICSARTATAHQIYRTQLATHYAGIESVDFARNTTTMQQGRAEHAHRTAVVATTPHAAASLLRDSSLTSPKVNTDTLVALLLPGSEGDYTASQDAMMNESDVFAATMRNCANLFHEHEVKVDTGEPQTFAISYATAQMWRSWGIKPTAVFGYGVGELAAAVISEIIPLNVAINLVAQRVNSLSQSPGGGALTIAASPEQVQPLLPPGAVISSYEGPQRVTVSAENSVLNQTQAALEEAGLRHRQLPNGHPQHHLLVSSVVPVLQDVLRTATLSAPQYPFFSASAGRKITPTEATDTEFWATQLARPSHPGNALNALLASTDCPLLLLETGPGRTLTGLARQQPNMNSETHHAIATLPASPTDQEGTWASVMQAAAQLWTNGIAIQWEAIEDVAHQGRIAMPGYPYERKPYWVDISTPPQQETAPPAQPLAATTTDRLRSLWAELLGHEEATSGSDFFDLGGNSLSALSLMARIRTEFKVELGIDALFDAPTPAALALLIERKTT